MASSRVTVRWARAAQTRAGRAASRVQPTRAASGQARPLREPLIHTWACWATVWSPLVRKSVVSARRATANPTPTSTNRVAWSPPRQAKR